MIVSFIHLLMVAAATVLTDNDSLKCFPPFILFLLLLFVIIVHMSSHLLPENVVHVSIIRITFVA